MNHNFTIIGFLRQSAYLTLNKELMRLIGVEEALLYSELLSKYYYYKESGALTENGLFYYTLEDMERETTLNRYKQDKAIKHLESMHLIKCKALGLSAKRYFLINDDEVDIMRIFEFAKQAKTGNFDKLVCKPSANWFVNCQQTSLLNFNKLVCKPFTNPHYNNIRDMRQESENNNYNNCCETTPTKTTSKEKSEKTKSEQEALTKEECFTLIDKNDNNLTEKMTIAVKDWVEYKAERTQADNKEKFYTPKGFRILLSEISNNARRYDEFSCISIINLSIASNWKNIIWQKLMAREYINSLTAKPPEVKKSSFDIDKFANKAAERAMKYTDDSEYNADNTTTAQTLDMSDLTAIADIADIGGDLLELYNFDE